VNPYTQTLLELGIVVLPGESDLSSLPSIQWRPYQTEPPSLTKMQAWARMTDQGWVLCGSVSRLVVIDADNQHTSDWWLDNWPELDETFQVETPRGRHFYLRTDEVLPSWSVHQDELSFDVRGEGGGVMGPGSLHPTGVPRVPNCPLSADTLSSPSEALLGYLRQGGGVGSSDQPRTQGTATERAPGGSQLADLLANPPEAGGRNVWLTSVAGHLAKREKYEDTWLAQVWSANRSMVDPLEEAEVTKITTSIWSNERAKNGGNPVADASTGWLRGDGQQLLITRKGRKAGEEDTEAPWSDFDPHVLGVVFNDEGELDFWRLMIHRSDGTERECTLEARTLAHPPKMNLWCIRNQATIYNTSGAGGSLSKVDRMFKYLTSQDAPVLKYADQLGWNDEVDGFVTPTHVIRPKGHDTLESVGVAMRTADRPYEYGFDGSQAEALAVLREVLTFHEETVCSVFGAWWVACVLKGQILRQTSQFPMVVISAPSESGKSTGFFPMMVGLSGAKMRHGAYTAASLRDLMSLNRSGIVWMDDITDLGPQRLEFLRQATVEGEVTKKGGEGFVDSVTVRLVSPVLITGEGFQVIDNERAMADRVISMTVGSPTQRRSIHGDYPQWDDIVLIQDRYPDGLGVVAGHLVQAILARAEMANDFRAYRLGSGRNSDKWAILRMAARVLDSMLDTSIHAERVDAWCMDRAKERKVEHYMITRVLPAWYMAHGAFLPNEPSPSLAGFQKDGRLYVNLPQLARWWSREARDERELQLGSEQAMRFQAQSLGLELVTRKAAYGTADNKDGRYQLRCLEIPEDLTNAIMEASGWVHMGLTPEPSETDSMLPFEQHNHEE
jgi:hypothetical protein